MEYEYSYKVKELDEYIDFLSKRYKFIKEQTETRTIYRNNGIIARITKIDNEMYLDFKEDKLDNKDLIVRKESKQIKFGNLENCEDILEFLGYKRDNTLVRKRRIYEGENIKFEIDSYIEPEKSNVFSFEGLKETCDAVYEELAELNKKYKENN